MLLPSCSPHRLFGPSCVISTLIIPYHSHRYEPLDIDNSMIDMLWVTFALLFSPQYKPNETPVLCFLHTVPRLLYLTGDIYQPSALGPVQSFLFVAEPSVGLRYPYLFFSFFFLTPCRFLEIKYPQLPHHPHPMISLLNSTCSLQTDEKGMPFVSYTEKS